MSCNHWLGNPEGAFAPQPKRSGGRIPAGPMEGKLANLNVANTEVRGRAPYKPLMLLTVIDLIESGDVPDGWVKYDVRLVSRFRDYWELVRERQQNAPDIPMPFHALGGDKPPKGSAAPPGQHAKAGRKKRPIPDRTAYLGIQLSPILWHALSARKRYRSVFFSPSKNQKSSIVIHQSNLFHSALHPSRNNFHPHLQSSRLGKILTKS